MSYLFIPYKVVFLYGFSERYVSVFADRNTLWEADMPGSFNQDTAITRSGDAAAAQINAQWSLHKPVTGYLAAIALRAAGSLAPGERPISASFDLTGAAAAGPVKIETKTLHASAGKHCIGVTLHQGDQLILAATVWSAAAGGARGLEHDFGRAPSVAQPEYYHSLEELSKTEQFGELLPLFRVIEERPVDWNSPKKWRRGAPKQTAWFRYPDGAAGDAVLAAAKSLVPLSIMPAFAAMMPHPLWSASTGLHSSTTRLAVNFHDGGDSDWLLVEGKADNAAGGLISGTAAAWNADGKLLATAITQLASA